MRNLIRQLTTEPTTLSMLLTSSLFTNLCALTPAVFVIIVLNKYLASGVTATLVSLTAGAIIFILFELALRTNRSAMLVDFNRRYYTPLIDQVKALVKTKPITQEQTLAVKLLVNSSNASMTSFVLDWPFVCAFLLVLAMINWPAAVITLVFMLVVAQLPRWKRITNSNREAVQNIEIFMMGLLTILIMSVGAYQIMSASGLTIGALIGSNILAARAFQGTQKYSKAKEFIQQRDMAENTVRKYVKGN